MKSAIRTNIALAAIAYLAAAGLATCLAAEPAATGPNLPYAVQFQQGAKKFLPGDEITITEVRGTTSGFWPGNIYCVKGTYKLASRGNAMLAAYVTASNAPSAVDKTLGVQWTSVQKGEGTFTLYLPMYDGGFPHVSFYPIGGGESFGGNYFGNDKFLLKKWWTDKTADKASEIWRSLYFGC